MSTAHQYQDIHEKCEVTAWFVPGKTPQIKSFVWRDRVYQVQETTLTVKAQKGSVSVWLISVATERAAFKLRFDADLLRWWVEQLMWEE